MKGLSQELCRSVQLPTTVANFPTWKLNRPDGEGCEADDVFVEAGSQAAAVARVEALVHAGLDEDVDIGPGLGIQEDGKPRHEQGGPPVGDDQPRVRVLGGVFLQSSVPLR